MKNNYPIVSYEKLRISCALMASMYETIMELPLFKGISTEQVSQFLEKTKVEFINYSDGESVMDPLKPVRSINFVLSGKILIRHPLKNLDIEVREIIGKGSVIGALRLYGIDTNYRCNGISLGKTSVMRIGKEQYMNALPSDPIYMLNYLNYLAAAAQRPITQMLNIKEFSIYNRLEQLARTLVSPLAESMGVSGNDSSLAKFCGVKTDEIAKWKKETADQGKILIEDDCIIFI